MDLYFATQNKHKIKEIEHIFIERNIDQFKLKNLRDLNFSVDIPENADTLEGNALGKARFIHSRFKCHCFADDTGLEVEALNGAPGVFSARYAGESKSFEDNMNKLLHGLNGITNRKARFRTVVALVLAGKEYVFEGIVDGVICEEKKGDKGFGYDPLFLPVGYSRTFAEMDLSEKNNISHRARAFEELVRFLSKL